MPKYNALMRQLDPRVIIAKCETPHDTARGKYTLQSPIVKSYLEFENTVIDYTSKHMEAAFNMKPPPDYALENARKFLDSSVGFDNAVFMGLSGTDGGMNRVISDICEGFKQEAKRAYFTYVLDTFVDPLSFPEILELMTELKNKLGSYSPQSFNYVQPEAMAANYKKILWNYIESLTRCKNLWKY